ncbi:MAG: nucleotide pyrophosphohydrolase [Patescibacteria group bacterium]|jgi:hypothetical protein
MEFQELINRAKLVRDKYTELEIKQCGKRWGALERTEGFVADSGGLMKLVMAKAGLRKIHNVDDVDAKLSHELADCLWSILVIADELGIDLEKEFGKAMDALEERIASGRQ